MTGAPRVVVVEDDDAIRLSVVAALDDAGYVTVSAPSAASALAVVPGVQPDLAVVDVGLGDGPDGLALTRRLVTDPGVPVIIVTAADAVEDRLAGFAAGADDYLTKPFAMEELLARVRALLKRSGRLVSPTWHVDDLVVDEAARTVRRGPTSVELTRTEFDLLCALGRRQGTVISKRQLLVAVWGFEGYDDNLVETYVSTLRRKLEASGPRLVHTVRGAGYVLRAP